MSSDLILSTSELSAKRIRLRQFQIIQRVTTQVARNFGRGKVGPFVEGIPNLMELVFDSLYVDKFDFSGIPLLLRRQEKILTFKGRAGDQRKFRIKLPLFTGILAWMSFDNLLTEKKSRRHSTRIKSC